MREFLAKLATKIGIYRFIVKIDSKFREYRMNKTFKQYGLETLLKGDEAFRHMGAKMIPIFGSLLGAYREHGFIPFDNDLDVAILAKERKDNIADEMKSFGFERSRQFYIKETGEILEEQFMYKGVQMDVFYIFEEDELNYKTYCTRKHEYKEWREANKTDGFPCVTWVTPKCKFIENDFLGHKLYMPEKTKEWLELVYGASFMTPIKNWSAETKPHKTGIRVYRKNY